MLIFVVTELQFECVDLLFAMGEYCGGSFGEASVQ